MSSRETVVPALPSVTPDNLTEVVRAIKNGLDVREGRLGDPMDQFVTLRELTALGLVNESEETDLGAVGGKGTIPVTNGGGTGGFGPDNYDEDTDLTTPPPPQGLTATGGYSAIYLSWYGNNYRNHAYTEVWRSSVDSLASAVLVGTTIGNLYSDEVGNEKTFYHWVRFVSRANVKGPYNSTSGTPASTALDVVRRLDVLRDDILNDQFVQELGQRLTITETGISRLDSVTSTQTKTIQQVSSVAGENKAAVQVLSQSVDGLSGQFSVKIDNNGHVSGFGLTSRPINGTPRSAFIVRADRFAIVGPNDATDPLGTLNPTNVPFTVLTTPTTIGGLTYPAGAWIKTAFIADATITSAKIQSLAADKITAGTITAAIDMQSPILRSGNIAPGTSGFYLGQYGGVNRFYVGNGSTGAGGRSLAFDGTNVEVRGTIYAYAGEITNLTARNFTVYDQNNNVLLSSSGINLANNGLGAFATISQITTANISTYIASAAIADAYIANLNGNKINANSITADKINTSGLEIKDAYGNVILRSGSSPINATAVFVATRRWEFRSSLENFTVSQISANLLADSVELFSTGSDPILTSASGLNISGAVHNKIQVRIKRKAGSSWDGTVYYATTGRPSMSGSYAKTIADGTVLNQWVTLEWDMSALTSGGTDWLSSTISQMRFDFGASSSDVFEIDWISVGRYSSGAVDRITSENASTFISDLAVNTIQIAGDAVTVPRFAEDIVGTALTSSWSSDLASTSFTISGLGASESARVVVVAVAQAYPTEGTVTNLGFGIFFGGTLNTDVYTSFGSNGIHTTNVGSALVGNGTYTVSAKARAEANPSGSSTKPTVTFVTRLIVMTAKR